MFKHPVVPADEPKQATSSIPKSLVKKLIALVVVIFLAYFLGGQLYEALDSEADIAVESWGIVWDSFTEKQEFHVTMWIFFAYIFGNATGS